MISSYSPPLTADRTASSGSGPPTRLSTDAREFLVVNRIATPPYIGPYSPSSLNPLFGTGDGFAPPRRLIVAAQVGF